jgi:hypothetical protein
MTIIYYFETEQDSCIILYQEDKGDAKEVGRGCTLRGR